MARDASSEGVRSGPRGMANTAPPPPAGRFQRSGARASGARASGARAAPVTVPLPAVEAAPRRAPPPKVEQPPTGDLLGDLIDLGDAARSTPGAGAPQSAPLPEQPLLRSASSSSTLASDLNGVRL